MGFGTESEMDPVKWGSLSYPSFEEERENRERIKEETSYFLLYNYQLPLYPVSVKRCT